jgi:hypothetical protein
MRIPGLLGLLVAPALLAGLVSTGAAQLPCPYGDISIGTVESEWLRRQSLSELAYRNNKCNALMPRHDRRQLSCALGLMSDCELSGVQAVGGAVVPSKEPTPDKQLKAGPYRSVRLTTPWPIFDDAYVRFRQADVNEDARVEPAEAVDHFRSVCLGLLATFAVTDRDGDGSLNVGEWSSLLASPSACTLSKASVARDSQLESALATVAEATQQELYTNADQDHDRCLRASEVTRALRSAATLVDVMEQFGRADADSNECLSKLEWSTLLGTLVVSPRQDR